jgi:hypothetical protein
VGTATNNFGSSDTRVSEVLSNMSAPDEPAEEPPLPQRVLDSVWLLAIAALLFFTLSYVVWGIADIVMLSVW